MSEERKIYCTHCGTQHNVSDSTCTKCSRPLAPKDHLLKEYLIRHTKDKIRGEAEDSLFELITEWLRSHIFASFIAIEVAATAITAVAFNPDNRIRESQRPASIENVSVLTAEQIEDLTMKTPTYDYETQKQILVDHFDEWSRASEFVSYSSYYLSDLDQNGLFEITSTAIMGTGFFSETKIFEVNENMDGIHPVTYADDREDAPDGFCSLLVKERHADQKYGYYDPYEKTWHFIMYDTWRAGWAAHGTAYSDCYLKNGKLYEQPIGYYDYAVNSSTNTETEKWLINDMDQGSEETFFASLQNQYADMIPFTYNITSISDDDMNDPASIVSTLMDTWDLKQVDTLPD